MNTNQTLSNPNTEYQQLETLLKTGNWQQADYETARIILKIANREQEGFLKLADIQNFPIEQLKIIDKLWLKYSNGHFGFSIQKQIYQNLTTEKDPQKNYQQNWANFCEQIGWKQGKKWLNYKDIECNLTAPKGHLPSRAWGCMVAWWWVVDWNEATLARIHILSHPDL